MKLAGIEGKHDHVLHFIGKSDDCGAVKIVSIGMVAIKMITTKLNLPREYYKGKNCNYC